MLPSLECEEPPPLRCMLPPLDMDPPACMLPLELLWLLWLLLEWDELELDPLLLECDEWEPPLDEWKLLPSLPVCEAPALHEADVFPVSGSCETSKLGVSMSQLLSSPNPKSLRDEVHV